MKKLIINFFDMDVFETWCTSFPQASKDVHEENLLLYSVASRFLGLRISETDKWPTSTSID